MTTSWLRRAVLATACASGLLLAACGSSTIESSFTPARLVGFGDAWSDLGNTGLYTIKDGSGNLNWVQELAGNYGRSVSATAGGGTSYAQGSARITATPDAAGSTSTLTVQQQVSAFLAGNAPNASDLYVFGGGTDDIVAEMASYLAGNQTQAQMLANVQAAGTALGGQVRRMVQAGAGHVVVSGVYNLGVSPWAINIAQTDLLSNASSQFNQALLVSIVDLGGSVLYLDAAYYYNLLAASPSAYTFSNVTTPVCTSVDPGPGIGIGTNQVNSALCNGGTLLSGVDYTQYVFADALFPVPKAQRLFGDYTYNKVRARW